MTQGIQGKDNGDNRDQLNGFMNDLNNANNSNMLIAQRLTLSRQALGLSQIDFGQRAGLSQPQYHQFETGKRRLSLDAGLALCDAYSLSLDWLYCGDSTGLPKNIAAKIKKLSKAKNSNKSETTPQ